MTNGELASIGEEYEDAGLGDPRLDARLLMLATALGEAPNASLARATKTVAAREAAYRFVENRRVTMDALLEPHRRNTIRRCAEARSVYVISDTTEFVFKGGERGKALGRIQGKQRGFLGHVALAVSASSDRKPLGVLGIDPIIREDRKKDHANTHQAKRDDKRESLKWVAMVDRTEADLSGVTAIHVMDREGDIFELLSALTTARRHFVIRSAQDRRVVGEQTLSSSVAAAPVLLEREVKLSARTKRPRATKGRGHPQRAERAAKLSVSARQVTIARPKTTESRYPAELTVNIVHVFEPAAPNGEPAVEWLLLTSEPVDDAAQVAAVVDAYRARWLIEEYFKALKTGCGFEDRQLRSVHTLTNALGLLAPIAWRLLVLRWLDRNGPEAPADAVFEPDLLEALAARLRHIREPNALPSKPTVSQVMRAIARLGGHHKSNGPPGWQVLWAGLQDLLTWGAAFSAAKSTLSSDHS